MRDNFFYSINNKKIMMPVSIGIIMLYCLPYLILGNNASVTINDNLDSIFVWYKIILDTNTLFAPNNTPIELFMNGTTRVSFPSELNFTFLWFWLLGPVNAYIFERFLIASVGFFGMFLLLRQFIIPNKENVFIQFGVSIAFALLPHWPFGGLSVPGLPLLLYAFLNFREGKKNIINWMIIAIYPFYSSLITTGFFFLIIMLLLLVIDYLQKRKVHFFFINAILILGVLYFVSHYRLFISFLFRTDYVSHRVEFRSQALGLYGSIKSFVQGLYNSNQVIFSTTLLSSVLMWNYKDLTRIYKYILLFIVVTAFIISFSNLTYLGDQAGFIFRVIPINVERVAWLYPLLWSIIFAISLSYIFFRLSVGKNIVVLVLISQILFNISKHELMVTAISIKAGEKTGELVMEVDPTFKTFFAEKQFTDIANFIGKNKNTYRVLSIGMHPSISQYNGFYTLDGYCSLYDLQYKRQFRKIIKPEISKNSSIDTYFEQWGSRVYLFTAQDIGYMNLKGNKIELTQLEYNVKVMKELKAKYIFSAVKLNETLNPSFKFLHKFSDADSAWDIYLYEII